MKAVACPDLNNTDESDQIEIRGDETSDIARTDELEPINDPTNDDFAVRNTDTDGPDVSMLGIDMFCHNHTLDDRNSDSCLILRYLIFINIFVTL